MKWMGSSLLFIVCGAVTAQTAAPGKGTGDLAGTRVFPVTQGVVHTTANGGQSRAVLQGSLATGEFVAVHESVQPAGAKPSPMHTIQHSEFIVVREGTLAFEHDGVTEEAGPGGILYVAYGTLHTVRNVGSVPAKYVVIAIAGDVKK